MWNFTNEWMKTIKPSPATGLIGQHNWANYVHSDMAARSHFIFLIIMCLFMSTYIP